MYIQPLQAVESPGCYHVGGDVTIHPSATIAPGALIRADPNCKIEIGSAACVGMGVVLHACEGNIKIESGVSLGAAVLIVGRAEIGANASIGSSTTIRNCVVDGGAIVPAASLLGEVEKPLVATADNVASANQPNRGDSPSTADDSLNGASSHPTAVDEMSGSSNVSDGNSRQQPVARGSSLADAPLSVNGQVNGHSSRREEDPALGGDASAGSGLPPSSANYQQAPAQANSRPLVSGPPVEGRAPATNDSATNDSAANGSGISADVSGNRHNLADRAVAASNARAQQPPTLGEPTLSQQSLLAPQPPAPQPSPAFGKSQVSRLMRSLFPHSQAHISPTHTNENSHAETAALPDSDVPEGVTSDPTL